MNSSKIFSLEGKSLKLDNASDIEPHISNLRSNNTVEEIRLGGNTLGVEACKALADVLETKKTLQIANLDDIFTSRLLSEIPPSLSSLLTALLSLPNLHTVNLSDNAFGLNTQAPLVTFLSSHIPLRHLILKNNGLGPAAGVLIADALTTLAGKKEEARKEGKEVPNLETVICGRNRLENGSMAAWAKAFKAHSGVKEVKMVQNGIRPEGMAVLLREGLGHTRGLRVLDLQDNTFTVIGAKALADVLVGWSDLRELAIGDCLLGPRILLVAQALMEGKNLDVEVLRLQFNDIDSKGLRAFRDAAGFALPRLTRVELNGNKFSEEDPSLEDLRMVLEGRREALESEGEEVAEWGLDELDELEDESDEDEDEDEAQEKVEEETFEQEQERVLKDADEAENENVPQKQDKKVDELAERLRKTEL
ncbi:MAG: hypothetical protein M1812_001631 [Candelaria pacifica]|nr:MAG: hypothetical protein M1812_001631 [Candelaria pacifica]